jgi:RNA polymerase sigma-70 factor (ECF subfamily)
MQIPDTLQPAEVDLLYRTHHRWLRGWLSARTGCRDNAADLAQDTFVRLLKARQASPLKAPRAYLSSIARGLMIDQFRRRALEKAYLESLANLPELQAPSEEQRLVILDTLERLDSALHSLKPARARPSSWPSSTACPWPRSPCAWTCRGPRSNATWPRPWASAIGCAMPTSDQQPTQAQVDQAIDWLVKLRYDSPGPRTSSSSSCGWPATRNMPRPGNGSAN